MRANEFINEQIDITNSVTGHHHGQTDMRLTARSSSGELGYIDYSVYQGIPHINMIQVHQKRQKVGTELVKQLQRNFPAVEIEWGSMTPAGAELYKSLPVDKIPNNRVIRMRKHLETLKQKEEQYKQLHAKWEASGKTEKDREQFLELTADWNDLYDEISDLERELEGQREYTTLIKT